LVRPAADVERTDPAAEATLAQQQPLLRDLDFISPDEAKKRDYDREETNAALVKSKRLVHLREQRTARWSAGFALTARALVLAGLPLRPTKEKQITRSARLGDGSVLKVTFAAVGANAQMPFGADTNLLHFLMDRACRVKSRVIEWRSAAEYLRFMGMDPESRKNIGDLRQRFARIAHLAIYVEGRDEQLGEEGRGLFVIEGYRLPSSVAARTQAQRGNLDGEGYGVVLSEALFGEAQRYPVPVPKDLIRELRDEPLTFRLAILLGYRSFAARSESAIPWNDLKEQTGASFTRPRDLRRAVDEALERIKVFWPELEAEVADHGLVVGPSRDNQHLFIDAQEHRR
jgi:hypothetical protein